MSNTVLSTEQKAKAAIALIGGKLSVVKFHRRLIPQINQAYNVLFEGEKHASEALPYYIDGQEFCPDFQDGHYAVVRDKNGMGVLLYRETLNTVACFDVVETGDYETIEKLQEEKETERIRALLSPSMEEAQKELIALYKWRLTQVANMARLGASLLSKDVLTPDDGIKKSNLQNAVQEMNKSLSYFL